MSGKVLIGRLKALVALRALFVTLLLGSFFVFHIGYKIFPYPSAVNYLIIALYALTIAYSLLLGRVREELFAYVQLTLDALLSIALIVLTGGIDSWFNSLPLLIVIAAAIVLNKRAGYVIATLSSILYGSTLDLQFYSLIPVPFDPIYQEKDFFYNIFSHISALFLTAYLIGHLTTKIERRDIDLEDLSAFNREVIENTPSGLFTADLGGVIKMFNRAAEDITGIGRNSAVGHPAGDIFPFLRNLGEASRMENRLNTPHGVRIIGLNVSYLKNAQGRNEGFIGVFQDLTEIKNLEDEVKHKEKLAARGELSASIAHEIRNPLASLKSSIEMLKEDSLEGENRKTLMGIALNEMDRLNRILTDFLDYSKPNPPAMSDFDLHAALEKTADLLNNCNSSGVSLIREFGGPLMVNADEQKLHQVFWNLGLNALEAMPDGGSLSISTSLSGGVVSITFSDTGRGIGREDLGRVFYPFFTTRSKGTGLGLSIAYRIVEDHGGTIKVQSSPGKGARFDILIPQGRDGN